MTTARVQNPITLRKADRAVLVGASGTGKSTLSKYLLDMWREDYPDSRIMVVDTKPRWRAEILADGSSPRKLYKNMTKGDVLDGSMALSRMGDWPLVWNVDTNPSQTVIVQRIQQGWQDRSASMRAIIPFAISCIERFFAEASTRRPSLLYIDEGHDFFTANGQALGSDAIQRCYRAGRELGMTSLAGFQRPKGLNMQLLTELNYCALFRINYADDVKRLYDMGWPKNVPPPSYQEEHCFRLWREGKPKAPMFRLNPSKEASRNGTTG